MLYKKNQSILKVNKKYTKNIPKYTKLYKNIPKITTKWYRIYKIYQKMVYTKHNKIYKNIPKYTKKIKIYQTYTKKWVALVVITPIHLGTNGKRLGVCKIMETNKKCYILIPLKKFINILVLLTF